LRDEEEPANNKTVMSRTEQHDNGQSVRDPPVDIKPMDNMLKVISVVQHIITELGGAVLEEAKIFVIRNLS
jgi:hypothetical protein